MRFAREVSDRVIFMDNGTIIEEGTLEHFFITNPRPYQTFFESDFITKKNVECLRIYLINLDK